MLSSAISPTLFFSRVSHAQEIKLPNEQLVDFLLREQTLTELMHLLVDAPSNDLEGDEKFNLPNAACEVLCCEVSQNVIPKIHSPHDLGFKAKLTLPIVLGQHRAHAAQLGKNCTLRVSLVPVRPNIL